MKYFFVLGKNPTLSIAELSAIFPNEEKTIVSKDVLTIESEEIDAAKLIKKLGGVIKIGEIKGDIKAKELLYGNRFVKDTIELLYQETGEGKSKFHFGISYYGNDKINTIKTGMEIKKELKNRGVHSRFVSSKEKTLSSVVVQKNKLVSDNGMEMVLIKENNRVLIGKTIAVQAFQELSFRDFGRPSRDDHSGMIPPKLAQIMINLTGKNPEHDTILDPFCGSGTILSEAALIGYKNIVGSDISDKAVSDSKQNIEWIQRKFDVKGDLSIDISVIDVKNISDKIERTIDCIVTEPYLGPQRGSFKFETINELESLYSKALSEFEKIIKKDGVIVMIWPVFLTGRKDIYLNPKTSNFKIVSSIPEELIDNTIINLTNRNTIVYKREDQRVGREIIILKKNN